MGQQTVDSEQLKSIFSRWRNVILVLVGIAAAVIGERLTDDAEGWGLVAALTAWIGGLTLAAGAPIFENIRRLRREATVEDLLVETRREIHVALNDALDPLIAELSKVATAKTPEAAREARGSLIFATLTAASQLVEAPRARANFFRLEQSGKAQSLRYEKSAGRAGEPTTILKSGTEAGNWIIKMLRTTEGYVCGDTELDPPPGWDPNKKRPYRSFASVPCRASSDLKGMLTVDSPKPNSLSDEDVPLLRVLGRIITIAVVLTETQRVL